jgi:general nucleoside transport system ATP-binding protein
MRLELDHITKIYGTAKANDGIGLVIESGEIHGILGENGAGKSTLMKILSGFIQRTSGTIRLDDRPAVFRNPAEAVQAGIGMLYQDPLDFPQLSVIGNFMLGQAGPLRLERSRHEPRLLDLCRSFNFHLRPDDRVQALTVGERQQLELLRLLALGVGVLILDEPTTGISTDQKTFLFDSLRRLRDERKSVVLVSHKLEDVETLCDRVTVLRQGRNVGTLARPFDRDSLLDAMFGRPPGKMRPAGRSPGPVVLRLDAVSCDGGRSGLTNCSVAVHEGEVVGLAGLEGSGQELFLRVAAGLRKPNTGSVFLLGRNMRGRAHHDFRAENVAYVPAARLEEALIPGLTLAEHAALLTERGAMGLNLRRATAEAQARIERFRIRGRPETPVEDLSGGNQQRLLLSQLMPSPRLMLLENPTRGLDVQSAHWVWQQLLACTQNGAALVFSSAEIDEILSVADRVLVFFNGRVEADVRSSSADVHRLGQAIAGIA